MLKKINILLVILGLGILVTLWTLFKKSSDENVNKNQQSSSFNSCYEEERLQKVDDPQMTGLVDPGIPVTLLKGFYECNPLSRGDLVAFRYHTEQPPVIRVVRGIPGDRFEVIKDEKQPGWKIRINGEFIKVGRDEDLSYGAPGFIPPLGLSAGIRNNIIGEGEVILMTNSHSGKFDSTLMGILSVKDIVGKIIVRQSSATPNP